MRLNKILNIIIGIFEVLFKFYQVTAILTNLILNSVSTFCEKSGFKRRPRRYYGFSKVSYKGFLEKSQL